MTPTHSAPASGLLLLAGTLYIVIVILGVSSEAAIRGGLVVPEDPAATAAAIRARLGLWRAGLLADAVMALCDVGLAAALYLLLKVYGAGLALAALVFRLVEAAIIGMGLVTLVGATLLITGAAPVTGPAAEAEAAFRILLHGYGYDVALLFFGICCLANAALLWRAPWFPRWVAGLLGAAGIVYLAGGVLRLVAPGAAGAFQAAYLVPLVAETATAVALLWRGVAAVGLSRVSP